MKEEHAVKVKPLPIGTATFPKIIEGGYLYIDKTELIYELVREPVGIYFLARPRRFGKSLLLSTLAALFRGSRELFRGLWIEQSDYTWEKHPVIHLDLNLYSAPSAAELEANLRYFAQQTAKEYGITLADNPYYLQFADLIRTLSREKQVVVLIDEYDKPLVETLENLEEAKRIRTVLKRFYSVLKSMEGQIRFLLLTGISRFSKVGVFSDLNNLYDISMQDRFAALPGITQAELERNFAPYVERFARTKGITTVALLNRIREWYNGFAFSKAGLSTYNPFSLLQLLDSQDFRNYWFDSGTPTFLIKLIKQGGYDLEKLRQRQVGELAFSTYELENLDITALLVQTGYLTIKSYDDEQRLYTLYYPNREVEDAFLTYLLSDYSHVARSFSESYLWQLIHKLQASDLAEFFEVLQVFFAQVPYPLQIQHEKYYQTIFYLIFTLVGLRTHAEVITNRGRIDAVIELTQAIYLFEFKLNGSAERALQQIKTSAYYEKYKGCGKQLHIIGVNFSKRKRGISGWKAETLPTPNKHPPQPPTAQP